MPGCRLLFLCASLWIALPVKFGSGLILKGSYSHSGVFWESKECPSSQLTYFYWGKKNVRITPAVIALKDTVRPPNWTPSLAPLGQYTYYNRFRRGGHSADVGLGVSTCISVPAVVSGVFTFHTLGSGSFSSTEISSNNEHPNNCPHHPPSPTSSPTRNNCCSPHYS